MPDIRNCKKCGKIYNYIGGAMMCPVCKDKEEEDFKRVKNYLYDNPGASITQVSSDLDISIEMIKRFLKAGRLEILGNDGNLLLECENCGKAIRSGRYCEQCERNLSKELQFTAGQLKKSLTESQNKYGKLDLRFLNKSDYKRKDQ